MSVKQDFAKLVMQNLAGEGTVLSERLVEIFSRILARNLDDDLNPTGAFAQLIQVFTWVSSETKPAHAPVSYPTDAVDQAVDDAASVVPTGFALVDTTDFVDTAVDAEPSVAEATTTVGRLVSIETVKITVGEDAIEVKIPEGLTSANNFVNALNADEAFAEAGLEAAYTDGRLTITDPDGRALSDAQLLDGGAAAVASTVSIETSAGVLVSAESLSFTLDGIDVSIVDIEGDNGTEVATSIQDKIRAITVEEATPFADVEVAYNGEDRKLEITDPDGRDFSSVELLDGGEPGEKSVASVDPLGLRENVAQVEIILDGVTARVDAEGDSLTNLAADLQTNIQAWEDANGSTPFSTVTAKAESGKLVIEDDRGREFSSVKLLDAGDEAVASEATIGGLISGVVRLDAGLFSMQLGNKTILPADVEVSDTTGTIAQLAANIQDAIGDDDVTVEGAGSTLTITDAAGRAISEVSLSTSGEPAQASTATIANLTDPEVLIADQFSISVAGEALTVNVVGVSDLAGLQERLNDTSAFTDAGLEASLTGDDESILTITNEAGQALSDVDLVDLDSPTPSTATIGGLTNAISGLDAARFSVTIGDTTISLADVSAATDTATLAEAIQDAIDAAGIGGGVTVDGSTVSQIVIRDPAGREISGVALTEAGGDPVDAVTTIDVTDVESFGAFAATVVVPEGDKLVSKNLLVDLREAADIDGVVKAIGDALPSGVTVAKDDEDEGIITLTNTTGYSISDVTLTSDLVAKSNFFDLSAVPLSYLDGQTVTLANFNDAGNKSDLGDDTDKSNQLVKLPNLTEFTGELTIENMTTGGNDRLDLSATPSFAELVDNITVTEGATESEVVYLNFTVGLTDGGTLIFTNLITEETALENAGEDVTTRAELDALEPAELLAFLTADGSLSQTALAVGGRNVVEINAKSNYLDLSGEEDLDGKTVKLAELDTVDDNKSDVSEIAKSNQLVKLPDLTDFDGTLTIENMTTGGNDRLDLSATPNFAALIVSIEAEESDDSPNASDPFLTFTVGLTDGGTLIFTNLIKRDTALENAGLEDLAGLNSLSASELLAFLTADGSLSQTAIAPGDRNPADDLDISTLEQALDFPDNWLGSIQQPGSTDVGAITTVEAGSPEGAGGFQVGNDAVIVEGIEAGSAERDEIGPVQLGADPEINNGNVAGTGSTEIGNDPVVNNGSVAGLNPGVLAETGDGDIVNGEPAGQSAQQVGGDPEIDNGNVAGADPQPVVEAAAIVIENGSEGVDLANWTATFELTGPDELAEDSTFTLTLTEVLGDDAEDDAEADVVEFTLEASAGDALTAVANSLVTEIDADALFSAMLLDDDETSFTVTADTEETNYTVETSIDVVGINDNGDNGDNGGV